MTHFHRTSRLFLACCLTLTACAKLSPGGASLGDPCLVSSDCADPYICVNGRCTPSAGQLCTATTLRCNGDDVEQCSPSGDAWTVVQMCTIGCVQGACVPPVCTAGQQTCQDDTITECLSDGSRMVPIQTCPTSCIQNPTDPTKAECTEPICTPGETQCDMTAGMIDTCNGNGTMWNSAQCSTNPAAPEACVQGHCSPIVCVASSAVAGSAPGQERCNGSIAEECNTTGTAWQTQTNGVCPNGCNYDTVSGLATCPPQICVPLTTSCDPTDLTGTTLLTCNGFGTVQAKTTCAVPSGQSVCQSGQCVTLICNVTRDGSGNITGRDEQCNGNILQQCDDHQTGWENLQTCQYGCIPGVGATATCGSPACQPGQGQCQAAGSGAGQALELCSPDQSGFSFVQYCPSGCTVDNTQTPPVASCNPPVCSPLTRSCGTDMTTGAPAVEECRADGTGTDEVETCSQTCAAGACVVSGTVCTPGDVQCNGVEVQQCVQLMDGTTQWEFVEHCFGSCVSGACSAGGACGCDPVVEGPTLAQQCGGSAASTPQPVTVNALLQGNSAGNPAPCGDGVSLSTVLVYTAPITDAFGAVVPDGTEVTFANDSAGALPDNLIVSADSDPSAPGIQRPTQNGVAVATLAAPASTNCGASGTRTVTVTASAGGSCVGSTQVFFAAADTSAGRTVFIAQDFSTTVADDPANTPAPAAAWNTVESAVVGQPGFNLGTGVDGDQTLSGSVWDMQQTFAPAWNVLSISPEGASIDGTTGLLSPGDEVLVATIWGAAGSISPGNYEFHHVASLSDTSGFGAVTFTEPVGTVFGNGTNLDVTTGQRTILQRVPQFASLTVPAGTTLVATAVSSGSCTTSCTPAGGTGILAFRVAGTLQVSGSISMDGAGLPTNLSTYPATQSTASLNRLLLGPPQALSGASACPPPAVAAPPPGCVSSGGGAIYIAAGSVVFPTSATIHSSIGTGPSGGGGGGTVWVSGANLRFSGLTRVLATGGTTGRTRVDYSVSDFTSMSVPAAQSGTQSTFIGQAGAEFVQSTTDFLEPATTGFVAKQATLFGVIGGSGFTSVALPPATMNNPLGVPQLIPGVNVWLSSDGAMSWGAVESGNLAFVVGPGAGQAGSGRDVRFRAALAPPTSTPLELRGLAFSVTLH